MSSVYILYGIKNCDSVKKAGIWLEQHGLSYQLHDFRREGLDSLLIQRFIAKVGWEILLNKRSTSWRQLDALQKTDLNAEKVTALFLAHPTLIKRPVLDTGDDFIIGFNAETYQTLL